MPIDPNKPPSPSPLMRPVRAVRRRLSTDSAHETLKTLVWVAPLTVLIWFYAERQAPTNSIPVQFSVQLKSPVQGQIVKWDTKIAGAYRGKINGPRQNATLAQGALIDKGIVIQLKGDEPLKVERTLTADAVERSPFLRAYSGVTLSEVGPSELKYTIDRIVERQVPIRIREELQAKLTDVPAFDPPTVRVTGPEETLKNLEQSGQLVTYADFAGRVELNTPGAHDLPNVPLALAVPREDLSLGTTYTLAKVEVKKADQSKTVDSVAVKLVLSQPIINLLGRYTIELQPSTIDRVVCTGPAEEIARLDKRVPIALLTVSSTAASGNSDWQDSDVTYDLPPRVAVDPASQRRTVKYRFKPRDTSTP